MDVIDEIASTAGFAITALPPPPTFLQKLPAKAGLFCAARIILILSPEPENCEACHEMAVIRDRIWSWSASHRPHRGADREEVDEHGALCSTENPAQRPKGEARARQIG